MVGMEHEYPVHRLGNNRVDFVFFARVTEHHIQKVFCIIEVVARVHKRLANTELIAHGRQRWHLCDESKCGYFAMLFVRYFKRIVIERRQGADYATKNSHWMSIATKALKESAQLLMNHCVTVNGRFKFFFLRFAR